jgi:hypothetical protein
MNPTEAVGAGDLPPASEREVTACSGAIGLADCSASSGS